MSRPTSSTTAIEQLFHAQLQAVAAVSATQVEALAQSVAVTSQESKRAERRNRDRLYAEVKHTQKKGSAQANPPKQHTVQVTNQPVSRQSRRR